MVSLTDLIAPSFYALHHDVKQGRHTHYWLKGGRGSTKSSFISVEIVLGIMSNPGANAVVVRKVGLYLKDSVYEQLVWAIEKLGVSHLWQFKLSPLELIYLPMGQRILFRGADKPKKLKSTKVHKGYIRYIWYEEVDEFGGMEEIRTINQSLMRGGEMYNVFYSYNPPQSQRNWVNEEVLTTRSDRVIHHSTYLSVPPQWLGEQFILEAEHLKKTKPSNYNHEYLGEVTGTGGEVFTNLDVREISEEEIAVFDRIRRGIDFGYAVDPFAYLVCHYDKTRKRLYLMDEIYKVGLSNRAAAELIQGREVYDGYIVFRPSFYPYNFRMFRVSDYNNMKSLSALFRYNIMNLFHKWAGSIYNSKTFLFDLFINAFFHSVRPDNDRTLTDHIQIFFRT